MKKLLILSGALCLLGSHAANAQVSVRIGEPQPVYYVNPVREYVVRPDWPSEHYDLRRRSHDEYWISRNQEERGRWERDHHDNGNHGEGNRGHHRGHRDHDNEGRGRR